LISKTTLGNFPNPASSIAGQDMDVDVNSLQSHPPARILYQLNQFITFVFLKMLRKSENLRKKQWQGQPKLAVTCD
jgi:hypothetical protein